MRIRTKNENDDEDGETPDKADDEDHETEGETLTEQDTTATSSSRSAQKHQNVFVKRRLMAKSPKRPITLVPPPEGPVKRRLLKKTDMRNDESVMNVDENLLNVVNKLTKDENMPDANPDEDTEMPKLTVLDYFEEMMKGRQKELNSLKEMGAMTGRTSEIQIGLERLQSMSGAHTARDVFTNTVDVVSENDAGCELTRRVRPHHGCN